ncbi:MAG TPA: ATP-binding protein [bacterium]
MAPERGVQPPGRLPTGALIVVFALTLIAGAWADTLHRIAADRDSEVERIYRENDALARAFEEHVRRVLRDADGMLLALQHEFADDQGRVTPHLARLVERSKDDPSLNQVAVVDARGNLALSALPLSKPINIARNETFRVHAEKPDVGFYIATPVRTQLAGTWSFFVSRRVELPDGTFAGVVTAGLDPGYFEKFYEGLALGPDRGVMLVGRDGIVRARRFKEQTEIGQDLRASPMLKRVLSEPTGHYEVVAIIDKVRRFSSYRAMPDYPLVVVVADVASSALGPWERRAAGARLAAAIFTIFVAGFCGLLILGERRTRRQHAQLTEELAERRRAEAALHESQHLFAAFLDNIPAAVYVQDLGGRVLYSNQAYRDLPGRGQIGRNARELLLPAVQAAADGTAAQRARSVALDETVDDGAGGTRIYETRMFVVERAGEEPLLGCVSVDSTGRRNAEVERLVFERRMQQAQKLESLGVLAGGIAHDFNNLLMVILGNADLALAKAPPESPLRPFLVNIETSSQRAADLTNQMLAYSGKGRFVVETLNLSRLVEEMGHLLATVISKRATVTYRLEPAVPPVDADATQIRQVVMNLITNASDALGGSAGTITVSTRVEAIAPDVPARGVLDHRLPPGEYATIEVTDSGCGMDEQTLMRIFDPFFTTKQAGRGLGLASVIGIVRGHRGGIRVSSEPGTGTVFSVLLPVSAGTAERAAHEARPPATRPAGLPRSRILVVDDEESVRRTAQAMLEESGFEVVTAEDGAAGVATFEAERGRLGAVLLDLTMPRMGGEEAFNEMHRIDPGVPVLLMSGFDEQESVARLEGRGLAGFVRKPYRLQTLLERLREVLPAGPPPA